MPPVDVEERSDGSDGAGEASWKPAPVQRRKPGRRDRTQILIAVTIGAIALAVVKPWGLGVPLPSPAAAAPTSALPAGSAAPVPTPGPVIADRNAMACLVHQAEQVLTLERWPDREVKSWSQPVDGVVTISSGHVVGVGICPGIGAVASTDATTAPWRDPLVWGAAVVTDIQAVDAAGHRDLGRPPTLTVQADYVAAGVLYGPPLDPKGVAASAPAPRQSAGATPRPWPPGRYEIRYFFPGDPDKVARTVIVEITTPLHDS